MLWTEDDFYSQLSSDDYTSAVFQVIEDLRENPQAMTSESWKDRQTEAVFETNE